MPDVSVCVCVCVCVCASGASGNTVAIELYDHRGDDGTDFNGWENTNLAANETAAYAPVIARLRSALATQFAPHDVQKAAAGSVTTQSTQS